MPVIRTFWLRGVTDADWWPSLSLHLLLHTSFGREQQTKPLAIFHCNGTRLVCLVQASPISRLSSSRQRFHRDDM